jgi:hypothetical protein
MIENVCQNKDCGLPFYVTSKRKTQKFCSRDCYRLAKTNPVIKNHRRIWHNGRRVYEHRLVWELTTGETLKTTDIIHHKNENKLDNRFENLEKLEGRAAHLHAHNYYRRGTWQPSDDKEILF